MHTDVGMHVHVNILLRSAQRPARDQLRSKHPLQRKQQHTHVKDWLSRQVRKSNLNIEICLALNMASGSSSFRDPCLLEESQDAIKQVLVLAMRRGANVKHRISTAQLPFGLGQYIKYPSFRKGKVEQQFGFEMRLSQRKHCGAGIEVPNGPLEA